MMKPHSARRKSNGPGQTVAVLVALIYPTLLTWLYFVRLDGQPASLRQVVFVVGKAIQFGFPIAWLLLAERRGVAWRRPSRAGVIWGLGSGLLIGAAILTVYFGWLRSSGFFTTLAAAVRAKFLGMGLSSPAAVIAMSLFYSLIHSLLEEYYWRWFVFGRLRRMIRLNRAIAISSLAFMAHHVILVFWYLPWPWAVVASAGVALGGALWAWRYQRDGSLWAPWISHLLVDAAIFTIGYQMAFAARGS
jgi:hypothetical protein